MHADSVGLPDPHTSYAVLVGVHTYGPGLAPLPAVAENLRSLRRAFLDRQLWGLAEKNCIVVEQPQNQDHVLTEISRAAEAARDTLIVYYSGHGFADPLTDKLFLGLPDSRKKDLHTALDYEWISRSVRESPARKKLVIIDACFAARAFQGRQSAEQQFAALASIAGTCILAASAENSTAHAPEGERYTAFTGELVDVLTRGVPSGEQLLDVDTLYLKIRNALREKSRPLPEIMARQLASRMALVKNRAYGQPSLDDYSQPARVPVQDDEGPAAELQPPRITAQPRRQRERSGSRPSARRPPTPATGSSAPVPVSLPTTSEDESRRLDGNDPSTWHGRAVHDEVAPLSLGIETKGGIFTRLIQRNTIIPTRRSGIFTTGDDNQQSMQIRVFQGEREIAAHNRRLATLELDGIPPAPQGIPQIEISFDINASGVVNVTVRDHGSGLEQRTQITDGLTLPEPEIARMLANALEDAAEDRRQREDAENRNKAELLKWSIEKFLSDNGNRLPADALDVVDRALDDLNWALDNGDQQDILATHEALTAASQHLGSVLYGPSAASQLHAADDLIEAEIIDD